MIYVDDPDFTLHVGDVRETLREIADESVDCVVTSPPYWGLRDYGVDGQLGLEESPAAFVEALVDVFRDVRRVLAPHGTVWLNLGDSYVAQPNAGTGWESSTLTKPTGRPRQVQVAQEASMLGHRRFTGIKRKDLVGIPWRVALALQDDGWYLRCDIVWSKPNPMPESVTDRPTRSHEYVFLLTKRPRYYFDQEAVREKTVTLDPEHPSWRPSADVIAVEGRRTFDAKCDGNGNQQAFRSLNPAGRNVRSVWEITTTPFHGAHFATFPVELVRRALLAGCPEHVCTSCGAPRERIVEKGEPELAANTWSANGAAHYDDDAGDYVEARSTSTLKHVTPTSTAGWTDCGCSAGFRAGVVLDPFMGSGTTALVAREHGRRAVGIELNPEYAAIAARRLQQLSLLGENVA